MYQVDLIYFKSTGKYYSHGIYQSKKESLSDIWDEVRDMIEHPGLNGKWDEGPIYVEVHSHPHNHPKLLIPSFMNKEQGE